MYSPRLTRMVNTILLELISSSRSGSLALPFLVEVDFLCYATRASDVHDTIQMMCV